MARSFANPLSNRRPAPNQVFGRLHPHAAPAAVAEVLQSPGKPLESASREFLQPRLGFDLSRVRIHNDEKAAESARAIGSLAYAAGDHVAFGSGHYNPRTSAGLGLLAHELGHVAQQSGATPVGAGTLKLGEPGSDAEKNADQIANAAAAGEPLRHLQRCPMQIMRATRTYALTFDDGPHAAELGKGTNLTEKVLDTLKARGIKAGFFIQTAAKDKKGHPFRGSTPVGKQLVQRMNNEGHVVGIHTGGTISHELHTRAQKAGRLEGELESAKKYVKKETGKIPTLVRPPKKIFNSDVTKTYTKVGLTNLLWDVDGDLGESLPLKTLKRRIHDGIKRLADLKWKPSTPSAPKFVFLYHDIQIGTANNLGAIIDHIKATTNKVTKGADTADFAAP